MVLCRNFRYMALAGKIMIYINWLWRWIATAFGFLIFGFSGLLFKLVLLSVPKQPEEQTIDSQMKARLAVGSVWTWFVRYLQITGVVKVRYHGFERLGQAGQLVLVNHPSLLDVVFVLSKTPQLNCIVKKDLLHNPVLKTAIQSCGFLPNDESLELVEKAGDVLQSGQSLLIFPEGTRTGWDGKINFNRGAVAIGLRSAKVITPVVIKMNPPNYKKNQPWYRVPKQQVCYDFYVGDDIDPQEWLVKKPLPIAARILNQELQDYFQQETNA